jgi:ribosomal protein S27AE
MFSLKDILDLLDHWPKWKRIQEMPEQFDGLQKRIADLEGRLARCPGEGCPRCGELAFRVVSSNPHPSDLGDLGLMERHLKCDKCGYTEKRTLGPKSR